MNSRLIAIGNFFFKQRNRVFPVMMLVGLLCSRPGFPGGDYRLDLFLDTVGLVVCLAGQLLRGMTIGYEYIKRGGKKQQIWAGRLITGGVFSHTRNPLYVGNILIFCGIALIFGSPAALLAGIPAVLCIYLCIIAAEENFLRNKFGAAYDDYSQNVNRLWPDWHGFSISIDGMAFQWKRVLNKEYGTTFAWILAAVGIRFWTLFRLDEESHKDELLLLIMLLVPVTLGYAWVRWLKKTGHLEEEDFSTVDA
jgi:protein-S-isoprenylcysteine O-methyltransferase Ste14